VASLRSLSLARRENDDWNRESKTAQDKVPI
jgi:hypothetical protein